MLSRPATSPALSTKAQVMRSESVLSQRAGWAAGQPISYLMSQALAHPELISLAAGFVDQQTLPVEPTRQALDAILSDAKLARAALQYGTTPGYLPLREQVLERLKQNDGLQSAKNLSIEQTVITAGSNELLSIVADTLCDPGDIVLTAAPSYFVFLGMVANLGARTIGVDADEEGMIPEAVEEQLSRLDVTDELARVKAIYVTTYFDNPSSVTLAARRRAELVEIAKRWSKHGQIYIIEDAAYRELRYRGEDTPSLRRTTKTAIPLS